MTFAIILVKKSMPLKPKFIFLATLTMLEKTNSVMLWDLGKYLGTPLLHKRVTKETYRFILDKVQQRLSAWKMKTLNMGGRSVLISSVIQSMPSYIMQTTKLPIITCDSIEKISRTFLWSNTGETNKMHLLEVMGWSGFPSS